MKRWATIFLYSILSVTCLLLLVPMSAVAAAWRSRRSAERTLAILRTLTPGLTTKEQTRQSLGAAARDSKFVNRMPNGIEYHWSNFFPDPVWSVLRHLPETWTFGLLPLHGTLVLMEFHFREGLLAEESVVLMQEVRSGDPHPASISVRVVARSFESEDEPALARSNNGFSSYKQYSQRIDESKGQLMGPEIDPEEFVFLDERVTESQKEQALASHLRCLTSLCPCNTIQKLGSDFPTTEDSL